MKKILFFLLIFLPVFIIAQEGSKKDTTNLLDEVVVKAVRVNSESPVTFSNLSKEEISKRN